MTERASARRGQDPGQPGRGDRGPRRSGPAGRRSCVPGSPGRRTSGSRYFVDHNFPVGIDAKIYYRGVVAWLHGANPWDAAVTVGGSAYHYAGSPVTTVILAPAALVSEDVFTAAWLVLTWAAAAWTIRRLKPADLVAALPADQRGALLGQPAADRPRPAPGRPGLAGGDRDRPQGLRVHPARRRGPLADDRPWRSASTPRRSSSRPALWVALHPAVRRDLEPARVRVDPGLLGVLLSGPAGR